MTAASTIQIGQLSSMLETFGVKHGSRQLPDILDSAGRNELSHREFLNMLLMAEVEGRNARKRKRNYAAAHFPPSVRPVEEFDASELEGGISQAQVEQLADLGWLDAHGNVVLAGPPGLGKTMVALGLGLKAVDEGYTVAFEKMESFIEVLDKAEVDRKAGFRLRYLKKAQLCIVDEIGYTPIAKNQANRFFSFVSDAYESSSMIFTTNKEITQWEELMGDQVLTTAMLDRILHHARCFSLRGESYRLKHPGLFAAAN
ncbi:IS21-like element helper ATPase IstB [Curtanaerobium respiraculi]|uniref:IS21-like element helper ATPase IstB n=1 Tax=Curtanaerobium respiraculi TaxID=2949669 RepID=UPI0024B354CC|nr:IS21-like element helper ATPase IstB [Curtanaerobium respiraculi]